jgi:MFS family permease
MNVVSSLRNYQGLLIACVASVALSIAGIYVADDFGSPPLALFFLLSCGMGIVVGVGVVFFALAVAVKDLLVSEKTSEVVTQTSTPLRGRLNYLRVAVRLFGVVAALVAGGFVANYVGSRTAALVFFLLGCVSILVAIGAVVSGFFDLHRQRADDR